VRRLKKSFSADILIDHPPLPRFPRYDVKRFQRSSTDTTTSSSSYIPPLPNITDESLASTLPLHKSELMTQKAAGSQKLNASMSNLNLTSVFNPMAYQAQQQHSVIDIVPNPKNNNTEIDQTIGIPIYNNNNNIDSHQVPTTIHQYPLISGTIPSVGTQAKLNFNTLPAQSLSHRKEPMKSSILTNTTDNAMGSKKESGEKNKVKFSDTITVAVVPEIMHRKEKMVNFSERMKRKTSYSNMMDPRRELAESLPLCSPNEDYLKDFSPHAHEKSPKDSPPSPNGKDDKSKKPTIKVYNFGIV